MTVQQLFSLSRVYPALASHRGEHAEEMYTSAEISRTTQSCFFERGRLPFLDHSLLFLIVREREESHDF